MTRSPQRPIALVAIAYLVTACSSPADLAAPGDPTGPKVGVAPNVISITPNIGSTGGGAFVRLMVPGAIAGAVVEIGGARVGQMVNDPEAPGSGLLFYIPPHVAGNVDVVVTNPNGLSGTLAQGYTYVSPGSFDFNGNWSGYGGPDQGVPILFRITDGKLVSISCDGHGTLSFSSEVPVIDGAFSFLRADGVAVSGRIVSPAQAVGTMNLAFCANTYWGADKI